MINVAIVEDEADYREEWKRYLARYGEESGESFRISVFADGFRILENYRAQYDIILMDIRMEGMDGMAAAEKIRKVDPSVIIIFITNMSQYAIRGYSVDALDYMLKPVSYFAFTQRLERAFKRMRFREDRYMTLRFRSGVKKMKINDIYYIEVLNHDLIFHTKTGEYTVSGTLKNMEEQLRSDGFFRCSKCYLVNLRHVDGMRSGFAVVNGDEVRISRNRKTVFLSALSDHIRETVK
ncbi:MAG: LytTR family DNA-binding domain-containing protein [Clostridiales Family XIII bacterium]|nr:LytTR family DNA-binding domain-containing protein [Clostridiales Family XIII bacterium]